METVHREKTALSNAMGELGLKEGLVLTFDDKKEEEATTGVIRFRPVWEWLLTWEASPGR